MENNVFTLGDLVQQKAEPVVTQKNPEDWLKFVENIFNTVAKFQEKAQKFQAVYGRPPQNKQEMKTGVPAKQLNQYTPATQEKMIREQEQKQKEGIKMKPKINEEKLDFFINSNIDNLIKKAEENKDKKVEELIKMFNNYKMLIVPKLKKEIKENLKEMIEYE